MEIVLANPRGFCAGVDRAIAIVNRALECFSHPIYVRHEVVHNKFVVDDLRQRGAIFVDELDEVPDDNIVIFSAHGVSKAVQDEAKRRGLKVFDATCPLVTKVHIEVTKYAREGREAILIGHHGHPEVEGTMGQYDLTYGGHIYLVEDENDVKNLEVVNPEYLAFVTQTTLSIDDTAKVIDALRQKFPEIKGPRKDDICYATQNRQDAVRDLAQQCDIVLVVGSPNSSNSNRLRELAERMGKTAFLVDNADELDQNWFVGACKIGVTAGASAPEILIKQVIQRLQDWGAVSANELDGRAENITFSLPKELRIQVVQA
ncbi:4-hydroxy-3-methylbut-2-enyl diphosphate reductase [Acinetobacter sp. ESL0695]|uniref:4-hydroxy-3-methylbut-2-enyl diphosphate reductase n=1 Tax=Acinetobacter pollinis TaxID=2605270 RepID=A0ABU6DS88_9GAMM|nr:MULTISPECIES: 4-hydroxy-3-methylbut-2-enyl diphosphate reductase [Acinetobacter]MEB5476683.1 4-hydroxy-3-methylbut-2-enyl diphosphate reductase [Acinetobacter pollinis]WEV48693.1 4-hydroxy-3-methylbut-2-enyl diphosphate reductase [Acinetobacter sp. ESL0695]